MENRTPRIAVDEHASEQGFWRIGFLAPMDPIAPFVRRFNAYAGEALGRTGKTGDGLVLVEEAIDHSERTEERGASDPRPGFL